jgi:hypothetical protein
MKTQRYAVTDRITYWLLTSTPPPIGAYSIVGGLFLLNAFCKVRWLIPYSSEVYLIVYFFEGKCLIKNVHCTVFIMERLKFSGDARRVLAGAEHPLKKLLRC